MRKSRATNYCNNSKPRYAINLTSKRVIQDLLNYSKSFKTKKWTVPKEIFNSNLEVKAAFIKGFFDSKGSASLKKPGGVYLSVCSWNKYPLLKIKKVLKDDFDINLSIIQDRSVMKLKSSGYLNVKNYYEKIGFVIKRKQNNLKVGLSTYTRKGVKRHSLELKKRALDLLKEHRKPVIVANILGIHASNISDWKNGRYIQKEIYDNFKKDISLLQKQD